MNAAAGQTEDPREYHSPHNSQTSLWVTFLLLLLLLLLAVAIGYFLQGVAGLVAGLTVAVAKAILIGLVFMNLRNSVPVIQLTSVTGLLWLLFAVLLIMADYQTRGWSATGDPSLEEGVNLRAYDRVNYHPDEILPERD